MGPIIKSAVLGTPASRHFTPGEFLFVLWFFLLPPPPIPALPQPACPRKKASHGVDLSSWEEETAVGSELSSH